MSWQVAEVGTCALDCLRCCDPMPFVAHPPARPPTRERSLGGRGERLPLTGAVALLDVRCRGSDQRKWARRGQLATPGGGEEEGVICIECHKAACEESAQDYAPNKLRADLSNVDRFEAEVGPNRARFGRWRAKLGRSWADLGRTSPMSGNRAKVGRKRTKFGRCRAHLSRFRTKFGRSWPKLAQNRSKSAQIWSIPGHSGRCGSKLSKFGHTRAEPDRIRLASAPFRPKSAHSRSNLGRKRPASNKMEGPRAARAPLGRRLRAPLAHATPAPLARRSARAPLSAESSARCLGGARAAPPLLSGAPRANSKTLKDPQLHPQKNVGSRLQEEPTAVSGG